MKIWKLNDSDYVFAKNLEDAKKCLIDQISDKVSDADFVLEEDCIYNPREVLDEELDSLKCLDEDTNVVTTFRQELEAFIADGGDEATYFTSAEW